MNTKSIRLPIHEWLVVVLLILSMFVLCIVTTINNSKPLPKMAAEQASSVSNTIQINISGAVENPGKHTVDKKITASELIKLIKPFKNANITNLKKRKRFRNNETIEIKYKQFGAR